MSARLIPLSLNDISSARRVAEATSALVSTLISTDGPHRADRRRSSWRRITIVAVDKRSADLRSLTRTLLI